MIDQFISDGKLSVRVKPNAPKTRIVGWDDSIRCLRVDIKAPAQDSKANLELVKFLTKLTKKSVKIHSGFTCKTKLLHFS